MLICKGGLRPEAESTYSWASYLIYKKLGMLPIARGKKLKKEKDNMKNRVAGCEVRMTIDD
ncbi:MAG: hypothetical protein K8F52_05925 [Candidatus Scalindua rubra]|nr:hypothetical protein [Candidatus Scalindua rubra]